MARPAGIWLFSETFFLDTSGGKEFSTVAWYAGSGTPIVGYSAAAAATAAHSHFEGGSLLSLLSNEINTVGTRVIVSNGTATFGGQFYVSNPGTDPGSPLPDDVCAVVAIQANFTGRKGRGRMRLAGIPADLTDGNYLGSGAVASWQTWANALKTAWTDQGLTWTLNLYSKSDNVLRPLISISPRALLGTQRHRRPRF